MLLKLRNSGTGYEVFWSHSSGKFKVWKVDGSGELSNRRLLLIYGNMRIRSKLISMEMEPKACGQ